MNILHIGNLDDDKSSGVSVVVLQYVKEQSKYIDVTLLNLLDYRFDVGKSRCFVHKDLKKYGLKRILREIGEPDLVVFHGLYFSRYIYVWHLFIKGRYPYIIVPHGALTAKTLEKHKFRKRVFNQLFSKSFIGNSRGIQFLTQEEKEKSVKFSTRCRDFVVPNGIAIPSEKYTLKDRKGIKLLYIGRYDIYHKGIDILLSAVEVDQEYIRNNNMRLVMHGTLKESMDWIKDKAYEKRIDDIVDVNDAVYEEDKEKILLGCDYFIQTSRSEGQPMSVLEAISYGIPVLLTEGTNMRQDVNKYKCGDIEPTSVDGVVKLFRFAVENMHRLEEMSISALECAKQYEWDKVIKKMIDAYGEIIDASQ